MKSILLSESCDYYYDNSQEIICHFSLTTDNSIIFLSN